MDQWSDENYDQVDRVWLCSSINQYDMWWPKITDWNCIEEGGL